MLELEGIILVLWQSPQVAVMCAGHSAVMKTLTSVDALCAVFVSIPDGSLSLPCSPTLRLTSQTHLLWAAFSSLSYCFADIVSVMAAKVVLKPLRILFKVIYSSPTPKCRYAFGL